MNFSVDRFHGSEVLVGAVSLRDVEAVTLKMVNGSATRLKLVADPKHPNVAYFLSINAPQTTADLLATRADGTVLASGKDKIVSTRGRP